MKTTYLIPESFYYYIPDRLYLTYDGYILRSKKEVIEDVNDEEYREEFIEELIKGNLIYIGEV